MTTLFEMQKKEIQKLVLKEKDRLGSGRAVATKCGVSEATISQIVNGKFDDLTDKMWRKVAAKLDYNATGWQIVQTTNIRTLYRLFQTSKDRSMWIAISQKAGNSKTTAGKAYASEFHQNSVFFLQAREWGKREFLYNLTSMLGINNTVSTCERMIIQIIEFFNQRREDNPLLIIDEADKLHADALRTLIPIFNDLEDQLGVVMMGTENLEKQFKLGLRHSKKGYDELWSRFGGKFIHLYGATKADVEAICNANEIYDKKKIQQIWKGCSPEQVQIAGQFMPMLTDLRQLKRAVQKAQLLQEGTIAA
ncbi:MAG: ATP-binding protein [Bacteroidota bacterium]